MSLVQLGRPVAILGGAFNAVRPLNESPVNCFNLLVVWSHYTKYKPS